MAWQVDLVNIVHFSTAAPQRGSHSKVRRLADTPGLAGLPEIERETWDEDTIEVAHFYSGIADPKMKAFVKNIMRNAVEITGDEPADAGPSGDGTD